MSYVSVLGSSAFYGKMHGRQNVAVVNTSKQQAKLEHLNQLAYAHVTKASGPCRLTYDTSSFQTCGSPRTLTYIYTYYMFVQIVFVGVYIYI